MNRYLYLPYLTMLSVFGKATLGKHPNFDRRWLEDNVTHIQSHLAKFEFGPKEYRIEHLARIAGRALMAIGNLIDEAKPRQDS